MVNQAKKEILVGLVATLIIIMGLVWVTGRLTDKVITSVSIIILFLIILFVLMKQLLPKKYRDAIKELEKKEKEKENP